MSTYMYDVDMDKEVDRYRNRYNAMDVTIHNQDQTIHELVKRMVDLNQHNWLLLHPNEHIRGIARNYLHPIKGL